MSHLGSEELRFTWLSKTHSSSGEVTHTAKLVSIRDNAREVIGEQDFTINKDASDEQQYRAISSAYVRQLKHLVAKRIPRDAVAIVRTGGDFRAFTDRYLGE